MSLEKKSYLGTVVLALAACSADIPGREQSSVDPPRFLQASDEARISAQLSDTALALQDVLAGLETGRCEIVTLPYEFKVVDQKGMRVECDMATRDMTGKKDRDIFELIRFLPKDERSRTAIVRRQIGSDYWRKSDGDVIINFNRGGELDAFRVDLPFPPYDPSNRHEVSPQKIFKCIPDSELHSSFRCGSPTARPEEYARSILDKTSVATFTDQIRDRLDRIFFAAESPDVNRSRLLRQSGSRGHRNR